MGLLGELKKYVKDAMPGGLLNPEVTSQGILDGAALSTTAVPVLGDLLGLGADLHRYKNEPESRTLGNFALSGLGMLPFVPAMTAWHGSPHKFDKFKLGEHIGTGDGTQMQGVGSYQAQATPVAQRYAGPNGYVYKTDIPDELVQKLFDLDKPIMDQRHLSEQLNSMHLSDPSIKDSMFNSAKSGGNGQLLYDSIMEKVSKELKAKGVTIGAHEGNLYDAANQIVSKKFQEAGIPGFRYLDRQSRNIGDGTSNFVIFDPETIRIIERNGVPTGQQPWKPGEWQGLLK